MKQVVFALVFAVVSITTLVAQENHLERMSDRQFIEHVRAIRQPSGSGTFALAESGDKCGFGLSMEIIRRKETMNETYLRELNALLAVPITQKSILSPSGKFRIYYDTTTNHTPAMLDASGQRLPNSYNEYAQRVAEFFDETYQKEVVQLGYLPPPNPPYAVYLQDYAVGAYGQTVPDVKVSSSTAAPCFTSHIEMDNDFRQYLSLGLAGAQVTAAHEFHHMIQLGSYGSWGNSHRYIYEMTSTYFEDVVYPDVNDYYQYLETHFDNPYVPFYSAQGSLIGYQKAIFCEMIGKKYGIDVIRRLWEEMQAVDPVNAMDRALIQHQTDFAQEICRFGLWNYYTAYRSYAQLPPERYNEAYAYPLVKVAGKMQLNGGKAEFNGSLAPTGSQYYEAYRGNDTVSFIVSNCSVTDAVFDSTRYRQQSYAITLVDYQPGAPYTNLSNGWSYKFETPSVNSLCVAAVVNRALQDPGIRKPFPNPFMPDRDQVMRIPLPIDAPGPKVKVYIYNSSMSLIFEQTSMEMVTDQQLGKHVVWEGKTTSGAEVPTGIYFYLISYGDTEVTGKFALIRR